jgi:hypothetical protein
MREDYESKLVRLPTIYYICVAIIGHSRQQGIINVEKRILGIIALLNEVLHLAILATCIYSCLDIYTVLAWEFYDMSAVQIYLERMHM